MDVVEISSDSEDTVIVSLDENEEYVLFNKGKTKSTLTENIDELDFNDVEDSFESLKPQDFKNDAEDDELNELFKKYLPSSSSNFNQEPLSSVQELSSESNEKILQELYGKYFFDRNLSASSVSTEGSQEEERLFRCSENEVPLDEHLISDDENAATVCKRKLSCEDDLPTTEEFGKKTKKRIVEERREIKRLERETKKKMVEKEKTLKKLIKEVQKSTSKEHCTKNIIVNLDSPILNDNEVAVIKAVLTENGISHRSTCNTHGLISWTRKIQSIENMICKEDTSKEKHVLVILPSKDFASLVRSNGLMNHIHSLSLQTDFKHLTMVVYGSDKPSEEQEFAMMEIEMFFKCYWQFVKKIEDLASLIVRVSKAVAQIPFKLYQQEKYKLQNEYFSDLNKDTVKVDKNGNGLSRLWHQMLTMFPLARLETAEAITAKYPTPFSLFKAYDDCSRKEELIQDLPIRRAVGPLASARKIGPELSKKCSHFFTSEDNIFI